MNVGRDRLKLRIIQSEQPVSSIRMPRCNPNGKAVLAEMPNNAAAEKSGSAENGNGATARCGHMVISFSARKDAQ